MMRLILIEKRPVLLVIVLLVGLAPLASSLASPPSSLSTTVARRKQQQRSSISMASSSSSSYDDALMMKQDAIQLVVTRGDLGSALENIRSMISLAEASSSANKLLVSECVEETVRTLTKNAFAQPHRGKSARRRINKGLEAIQLQLHGALAQPYDTVPRDTLMVALRALSGIISSDQGGDMPDDYCHPDAAFRILQRLLTGVGVRQFPGDKTQRRHTPRLSHQDFHMVLNAVSNVGRMDVAHKVVAMQERHGKVLTPVTYSILLKGYGRLRDLENVEMILSHAQSSGVLPDTVMLNSIVDAYVNCQQLPKAQQVFSNMTAPNLRTYNTLLKGHAKHGVLQNAISLSNDMKAKGLWDHVTTNTLVSAAVMARDFSFAETLLASTASTSISIQQHYGHPHVEAYTELLDGYAKAGQLEKALGVLGVMRQRGVDPNAYTYTCIIGALARAKQVQSAIQTLELISGLVSSSHDLQNQDAYDYKTHVVVKDNDMLDEGVDQSIALLKDMMQAGVRPNVVTIALLIEALGRCGRMDEAETLVAKFVDKKLIPPDNEKVKTAMIRAFGSAGDLKAALQAFREIRKPDVVAINAFMDAACRCGNDKFAFDTFDHFFGNTTCGVGPDVISYSVLVNSLLKKNTVIAMSRAQKLYKQMRQSNIMPDTAMVDIILTAMIRGGRMGLQKKDIQFILALLSDAEGLKWLPGQFQRRKQAVRAVMIGRSEVWKENEGIYGMGPEVEDELFKRKGWNKVDSGFRLWGGGKDDPSIRGVPSTNKDGAPSSVDEFLAAKGWNDVDSGFRIW
jgi:pentatricopeptide repeat protein